LPIIPVRAYFSTLGALPETHRRIKNNLKAGQFSLEVPWSPDSFVPPKLHEIEVAVKEIESHLEAKQRGTSEITGLKRAMAGLRIAASIAKPELSQISAEDLASFFGTDWAKLKERIIANSFSSHIHFIPSDGQDPAYSGIAEHSVVLFRYPLTTSIEIFDLAQHTTEQSWPSAIAQTATYLPAAESFRFTRPMKVLSMRAEFLHDLLSRYVAVYNRIGSPDFSKKSIGAICTEVDNS
jgi:hypothetical protein